MVPGLVIILLVSLMLVPLTSQSWAAESYKGKMIGVYLSKTCTTMLQNHINTTCPGYERLLPLDSSLPHISGEFVEKDGYTYRDAPKVKNSFGFYKFDSQFRVLVDPPAAYRVSLPIITIYPSLDSFHMPGQMQVQEYRVASDAKATKSARSYSHDRYVDITCTNAYITAKNWEKLLPDTVFYLRSGCDPDATNFQTITTEYKDLTKHDITTSQKWQHEKWLEEIKENCLQKRNSCDITQPISVKNAPQSYKVSLG